MPDLSLTDDELAACHEALERAGQGAVSHELAARAHGIDLLDDPVHRLTVARNRSRLVLPGWEVHRADLGSDVVEVRGVRVTTPARTLRDLARTLALAPAVVAVDSALRQGLVTAEELELGRAVGRSARRVRAVGAALDPACGSVLESLLRVLFLVAGLPRPLTQYVICTAAGEFVGRVDFCWPAARLVVEADGFAYHSSREAFRSDRRRLNELERLGWRVLRFSWEDVTEHPEMVIALVRDCLRASA